MSSELTVRRLSLYMFGVPGATRTHEIYRVTASWAEGTITWATQPAVAASFSASAATGTTSGVWITWASPTLASDVQAFANGTYPNYGWRGWDSVRFFKQFLYGHGSRLLCGEPHGRA